MAINTKCYMKVNLQTKQKPYSGERECGRKMEEENSASKFTSAWGLVLLLNKGVLR